MQFHIFFLVCQAICLSNQILSNQPALLLLLLELIKKILKLKKKDLPLEQEHVKDFDSLKHKLNNVVLSEGFIKIEKKIY